MTTDDEFPGFRAATDIFDIWQKSLGRQADIWNEAWGQVKSGSYDLQHAVKNMALVYEENSKAIAKVIRYPSSSAVNEQTPAWITFDLRGKTEIKAEDLVQVVQTRTFFAPTIETTLLVQFGMTGLSAVMEAMPIVAKAPLPRSGVGSSGSGRPVDRIRVEIKGLQPAGKALESLVTTPKWDIYREHGDIIRGSYLGMITVQDPSDRSQPPLAIVTLVL